MPLCFCQIYVYSPSPNILGNISVHSRYLNIRPIFLSVHITHNPPASLLNPPIGRLAYHGSNPQSRAELLHHGKYQDKNGAIFKCHSQPCPFIINHLGGNCVKLLVLTNTYIHPCCVFENSSNDRYSNNCFAATVNVKL